MKRVTGYNPEGAREVLETILNDEQSKRGVSLPLLFIAEACHAGSVAGGWWQDLETGDDKDRNVGEMMNLIHSEISEAGEGARKDIMDDHLPHRKMVEVELADTIIRILDFAIAGGYDVERALLEKLRYNLDRADHKRENRLKDGGKKN